MESTMQKLLFSLIFCVIFAINPVAKAADQNTFRNLDELISSDRDERIQKINELSVALNISLTELSSFKSQLEEAVTSESAQHGIRFFLRNGGALSAAIGIVSTVIYQRTHVNTNMLILSGGYTISGLAGLVSYMQNKTIRFEREEINKLRASVTDLEGKVVIEKRNLARELKLLCMSEGGSPESCEQ
jgi:hypothetical protein